MARRHHTLKTETKYYQALESGLKNFELRKNDRDFKESDMVELIEVVNGVKTGRKLMPKEITYLLVGKDAERFGLKPGYCIMGFEPRF